MGNPDIRIIRDAKTLGWSWEKICKLFPSFKLESYKTIYDRKTYAKPISE
jgi:hypothetical protein